MNLKNNCITINSYYQAVEIIKFCKKNKIVPVLFIKYYLINGLGIDWLHALVKMLQKEFKSKDFRVFVETKKNYGLFIALVEKKINFINVQANHETMKRLRQIAKLNKVSVNPDFSVVDVAKSKNVRAKLKKLYNKIL